MLRGFIADDQLGPLPGDVPVDDLLQIMAETRGVLLVNQLAVRMEVDQQTFVPGLTIRFPTVAFSGL